MKRADRKQQRNTFQRNEAGLRAILNEWDFIGGTPEDEYDCLAHHILSVLKRQTHQYKHDLIQAHGVQISDS